MAAVVDSAATDTKAQKLPFYDRYIYRQTVQNTNTANDQKNNNMW